MAVSITGVSGSVFLPLYTKFRYSRDKGHNRLKCGQKTHLIFYPLTLLRTFEAKRHGLAPDGDNLTSAQP
jgi:hypothetical protein